MKKKWILILIVLIILAISLSGVYLFKSKSKKGDFITIGEKKVTLVGVADNEEERNKGLSGTASLCEDCAMLFIYENLGIYPFWMKQMNYDLDIIWINGDKVVDITENARKPFLSEYDKPTVLYYGQQPFDRVLEVNSGWVKKNKIFVGDQIRGTGLSLNTQ